MPATSELMSLPFPGSVVRTATHAVAARMVECPFGRRRRLGLGFEYHDEHHTCEAGVLDRYLEQFNCVTSHAVASVKDVRTVSFDERVVHFIVVSDYEHDIGCVEAVGAEGDTRRQ